MYTLRRMSSRYPSLQLASVSDRRCGISYLDCVRLSPTWLDKLCSLASYMEKNVRSS